MKRGRYGRIACPYACGRECIQEWQDMFRRPGQGHAILIEQPTLRSELEFVREKGKRVLTPKTMPVGKINPHVTI